MMNTTWELTFDYKTREALLSQGETLHEAIKLAEQKLNAPYVSDIELVDVRQLPQDSCTFARLAEANLPESDNNSGVDL